MHPKGVLWQEGVVRHNEEVKRDKCRISKKKKKNSPAVSARKGSPSQTLPRREGFLLGSVSKLGEAKWSFSPVLNAMPLV